MKRVSLVLLVLLSCLPFGIEAATRLGLHVTQEELDIWEARRNDNVNGSNGVTFASMYTNRILNRANAFWPGTHPSATADGRWNPSFSGCFPNAQSPAPGRDNGRALMSSAFVYMLSGDATYGNPVLAELLAQMAVASTNFNDTSRWCIIPSGFSDGPGIEITPWITHLVFAYDYIRIGHALYGNLSPALTTQNRIDLETWFHGWARFWLDKANFQIGSVFSGRLSDNYTVTGPNPGGPPSGCTDPCPVYFSGPNVYSFHNYFSNRIYSALITVGAIVNFHNPVITINSTFVSQTKRLFEEAVKYAHFPNGVNHEFYRAQTDGECAANGLGSGWGHAAEQFGPITTIADHFARAGDLSLYNYTSSVGLHGTGGTTKGLQTILTIHAQMATGAAIFHGTNESAKATPSCILNANTEGGHTEDWAGMLANIYYQSTTIRAGMERNMTPTSGCGALNCFGGPWGVYVDIPFQWGKMDNCGPGGGCQNVNPFTLTGDTTIPRAPTNLRVP